MVVRDYRSALQIATASLHDEIDGLFGAFDLATPEGLTRFLMAQSIGMQACQPHAMRFGAEKLGCAAPDYCGVLKTDLAALGVDARALPRAGLAAGVDLAASSGNLWTGAGIFYVVAGSRMGAAVLRKRATALTPGGPAHGVCGYFAAGDGPAMWRLFREWLAGEALAEDAGGEAAGLAAMIDAATATFRLFATAAQLAATQSLPPLSAAFADAAQRPAA